MRNATYFIVFFADNIWTYTQTWEDEMLGSAKRIVTPFLLAGVLLIAALLPSHAAELNILVPNNLRLGISQAIKAFEKESGHKVIPSFAGSRQLVKRIQKGEKVDLIILRTSQLSKFKKAGSLVSTDTPTIARVGIGVAVKKGSTKPDVSSMAKLQSALRSARSVGHSDPKVGFLGKHLAESFAKFNLLEVVKDKRKTFPPGDGLWNAVANGEVELALGPISAIHERKDLEYAGPVPEEIQSYNHFGAGISKSTKDLGASTSLLNFLSSPPAQKILHANGL